MRIKEDGEPVRIVCTHKMKTKAKVKTSQEPAKNQLSDRRHKKTSQISESEESVNLVRHVPSYPWLPALRRLGSAMYCENAPGKYSAVDNLSIRR